MCARDAVTPGEAIAACDGVMWCHVELGWVLGGVGGEGEVGMVWDSPVWDCDGM